MSATHIDLLLWSRRRCFAFKNHRWGLWPSETCNSSPKVAVLHAQSQRWGLEPIESFYSCVKLAVMCAQNHRWGLGTIETWNSGPKCAVLQAQNGRWNLGPIEICYSGSKVAVLHAKTTDEGWDPWKLVILMLITLFCMQKPLKRAGTHRD